MAEAVAAVVMTTMKMMIAVAQVAEVVVAAVMMTTMKMMIVVFLLYK
ncbi:hypothetical protein AB2O84_17640 [Acinetobacter baumannii]